MEATTVLGRVTSAAPRERTMYLLRPVFLPSPRRNIRRRLIKKFLFRLCTYFSLLLFFLLVDLVISKKKIQYR